VCPICPLAKQSRLPFSPSVISSTKPFEKIHCDIWGRYRHPSISGAYYFLTVVDDYTRFTWIFLMRHKNKTQSLLKQFFSYVHTQFDSHIKIFQSDNGGEFLSLRSFFKTPVSSFNILVFTRPNKMGLWNANIVTSYR
jgi:hypothetical protein